MSKVTWRLYVTFGVTCLALFTCSRTEPTLYAQGDQVCCSGEDWQECSGCYEISGSPYYFVFLGNNPTYFCDHGVPTMPCDDATVRECRRLEPAVPYYTGDCGSPQYVGTLAVSVVRSLPQCEVDWCD